MAYFFKKTGLPIRLGSVGYRFLIALAAKQKALASQPGLQVIPPRLEWNVHPGETYCLDGSLTQTAQHDSSLHRGRSSF